MLWYSPLAIFAVDFTTAAGPSFGHENSDCPHKSNDNPRMKTIERLFVLLVLAALAGCSTGTTKTTGREFNTAKIQDIRKGVTTSNELVQLLGQPLSKTMESANVALWEYSWKKSTSRAATSSGEGVIETDGDQKTLAVLIKDGVVVNYAYKDDPFWNERLRNSQ